tara:strand:+ start:1992 stop:2525 length:534 start_codon:yes stop_codon:yes gene_type:complete
MERQMALVPFDIKNRHLSEPAYYLVCSSSELSRFFAEVPIETVETLTVGWDESFPTEDDNIRLEAFVMKTCPWVHYTERRVKKVNFSRYAELSEFIYEEYISEIVLITAPASIFKDASKRELEALAFCCEMRGIIIQKEHQEQQLTVTKEFAEAHLIVHARYDPLRRINAITKSNTK